MQDHVKSTLQENPDQIIDYVGTNDLASNKLPEQITQSIIGVATSLKSDTCDVLVSSITEKRSTPQESSRGKYSFKGVMERKKLICINHDKKITVKHLNGSKLHLNKKGTSILSNTFVGSISNALQ